MIKLVAFLLMFIDHCGLILFPDSVAFRLIGRLSMPLFAYGIAKGTYYSLKNRSTGWYLLRIISLGFFCQVPYSLMFHNSYFLIGNGLNICFTWAFAVGIIYFIKSELKPLVRFSLAGVVLLLAECTDYFIGIDYNLMGVLVPVTMALCCWKHFSDKNYKLSFNILFPTMALLWGFHNLVEAHGNSLPQVLMLLSLPLISLLEPYDKVVKIPRWLGYTFYPLSIIPFLIIRILVVY